MYLYTLFLLTGISFVEDLNLNFTLNNSLLISWSPPAYHSSDVTIDALYTYIVVVTDQEGMLITNSTLNNTSIEITNITECDTFIASVLALLAAYGYTSLVSTTEGTNGIQSIYHISL